MMHPLLEKKHTGTLFPLFSMRHKKDWGIGDTRSMTLWFDAMKALNLDLLQVLPINEMPRCPLSRWTRSISPSTSCQNSGNHPPCWRKSTPAASSPACAGCAPPGP